MNRPRVIIADNDEKYIIPLQLKFIREYFDKIDMEIITEREYFEELFTKPQKAEVLIVSDTLYSSFLQKHDITNIFVMTEQDEEGNTGELNIERLYKYTSIQEIFNEILGKSRNILNADSKEKKETQVILVTSASGGAGKTVVSMGISTSLTKSYKKVLYINAYGLQTFQHMLDNKEAILTSEIYTRLRKADERIYQEIKYTIRNESFSYLPPFKASLLSLGLDYSVYEKIILSAKKSNEYDFIVVDMENAFDENKTALLDIADKVIIVVEQSASSVYATNTFVSNITGTDSNKYVFICNKFQKDGYNALIAPEIVTKFTINEYINMFEGRGAVRCEDLSQLPGIRKVAFLVV